MPRRSGALGPSSGHTDWRELVDHPEVTSWPSWWAGRTPRASCWRPPSIARSPWYSQQGIDGAVRADLWIVRSEAGRQPRHGSERGGGIPILGVLREGIAGDKVTALFGILTARANTSSPRWSGAA